MLWGPVPIQDATVYGREGCWTSETLKTHIRLVMFITSCYVSWKLTVADFKDSESKQLLLLKPS